ncbi:hypothetical protein QBC34DRAFT_117342 [Podospora aff. communis PSN243]|uniref:Uncharacterized protein n=1 Tax=Podospora aff. communis PSN243 TaxID=3040156 RepID=A0AAV9GHQ9_9PEZI|nr:hypothetical protein QBC34DRAFT_117342 [Podospora aff. communis PSN243]
MAPRMVTSTPRQSHPDANKAITANRRTPTSHPATTKSRVEILISCHLTDTTNKRLPTMSHLPEPPSLPEPTSHSTSTGFQIPRFTISIHGSPAAYQQTRTPPLPHARMRAVGGVRLSLTPLGTPSCQCVCRPKWTCSRRLALKDRTRSAGGSVLSCVVVDGGGCDAWRARSAVFGMGWGNGDCFAVCCRSSDRGEMAMGSGSDRVGDCDCACWSEFLRPGPRERWAWCASGGEASEQ